MKNLFYSNPKLTKETKVIIFLMALLILLRTILVKDLKPFLFWGLAGALIGMLFMHLYDVKKLDGPK